MADPNVDELAYQEKGVFYTDFVECIRVLKVAANRIIALEGKVSNLNSGTAVDPSIQALPKAVNDLAAVVQALKDEADTTYQKLNKLFPDADLNPPNVPKVPDPVPPVSVPPASDTKADDTKPADGSDTKVDDTKTDDTKAEDKPADSVPAGDTVVDKPADGAAS